MIYILSGTATSRTSYQTNHKFKTLKFKIAGEAENNSKLKIQNSKLRIMIRSMFIVALGGAVGSSLRMAVSRLVDTYAVGHFPYPTMTVNVVGCLLIGVFYGLSMRGSIGGGDIKMLLTTGFCGGFTTFSTFCNENLTLLRNGHPITALLYAGASLAVGLIAVALGYWLAERI